MISGPHHSKKVGHIQGMSQIVIYPMIEWNLDTTNIISVINPITYFAAYMQMKQVMI